MQLSQLFCAVSLSILPILHVEPPGECLRSAIKRSRNDGIVGRERG
jgi:hypothetical protein